MRERVRILGYDDGTARRGATGGSRDERASAAAAANGASPVAVVLPCHRVIGAGGGLAGCRGGLAREARLPAHERGEPAFGSPPRRMA